MNFLKDIQILDLLLLSLYTCIMSNCGSNTLVIGRPSQRTFDNLCGNTGGATTNTGCGTAICKYVGPHDRTLSASTRKHREKVREDIKDYVLMMLGAPVVKIEIDEQQLDLAVNQTLKIFEDYAGREYYDYYTFSTVPGKSVYKMPDDVGMIRNVFYKEQGSFAFQASDLDGAIPIEYFYPGGAYSSIQGGLIDPVQPIWGRMGEWVLYKQYEQMFSRTSSNMDGSGFLTWAGSSFIQFPAKAKRLWSITCKNVRTGKKSHRLCKKELWLIL